MEKEKEEEKNYVLLLFVVNMLEYKKNRSGFGLLIFEIKKRSTCRKINRSNSLQCKHQKITEIYIKMDPATK